MSSPAKRRTPCAAAALSHFSSSACGLLRGSVVGELDEKDKKLQATQPPDGNNETDGGALSEISSRYSLRRHAKTPVAETAFIGGDFVTSALEVLSGGAPDSSGTPPEEDLPKLLQVLEDIKKKRNHASDNRPGELEVQYQFEEGPSITTLRYYKRREPAPDDATKLWNDVLEEVRKNNADINGKRIAEVKTKFAYKWHLELHKRRENAIAHVYVPGFSKDDIFAAIAKEVFAMKYGIVKAIPTFDGVEDGCCGIDLQSKLDLQEKMVRSRCEGILNKHADGNSPVVKLDSIKVED